jgi:hypothetical protein
VSKTTTPAGEAAARASTAGSGAAQQDARPRGRRPTLPAPATAPAREKRAPLRAELQAASRRAEASEQARLRRTSQRSGAGRAWIGCTGKSRVVGQKRGILAMMLRS